MFMSFHAIVFERINLYNLNLSTKSNQFSQMMIFYSEWTEKYYF